MGEKAELQRTAWSEFHLLDFDWSDFDWSISASPTTVRHGTKLTLQSTAIQYFRLSHSRRTLIDYNKKF